MAIRHSLKSIVPGNRVVYFQGILVESTGTGWWGRKQKFGAGRAAGLCQERQAASAGRSGVVRPMRELPWRNHGVIISQASAEMGGGREENRGKEERGGDTSITSTC